MRKTGVRFSPNMNRWFYGVFGVLFFSGVLWLVAHYLVHQSDASGVQNNSVEPSLLKIHGAAAMVSLMILGVMIPTHMRRAWDQDRNRRTAVIMISMCLVLIASGYALYYFGSEELRPWISGLHSVAGCLLPVALVIHILVGRKSKPRKVSPLGHA